MIYIACNKKKMSLEVLISEHVTCGSEQDSSKNNDIKEKSRHLLKNLDP